MTVGEYNLGNLGPKSAVVAIVAWALTILRLGKYCPKRVQVAPARAFNLTNRSRRPLGREIVPLWGPLAGRGLCCRSEEIHAKLARGPGVATSLQPAFSTTPKRDNLDGALVVSQAIALPMGPIGVRPRQTSSTSPSGPTTRSLGSQSHQQYNASHSTRLPPRVQENSYRGVLLSNTPRFRQEDRWREKRLIV